MTKISILVHKRDLGKPTFMKPNFRIFEKFKKFLSDSDRLTDLLTD